MTITGDQLYQQMLDEFKEGHGQEEADRIEGFIRGEAYDPAVLLGHNTTACPSWCDKRHDRSGESVARAAVRPYIIHGGPELCAASYDGSPNPAAPGWVARLVAYEYVEAPRRLHYLIELGGQDDGLHPGINGWSFEIPPEWLRTLTSALPKLDELLDEVTR